jgi:hypothetical protein
MILFLPSRMWMAPARVAATPSESPAPAADTAPIVIPVDSTAASFADSTALSLIDSAAAALIDSTTAAPADSAADDFESRYDRYIEIEARCRRTADPVRLLEAQALATEAEVLAAVGELASATSLLNEAIASLGSPAPVR